MKVHSVGKKQQDFALVLGLNVNGLGHIRGLGSKGINVIGIYTDNNELGKYSRFCSAVNFNAEKNDIQKFKDKLISLAKRLPDKPVIFATSDFYVHLISEYREELEKYFIFNLAKKNY